MPYSIRKSRHMQCKRNVSFASENDRTAGYPIGRLELEYLEVVRLQGLCHSLSPCSNAKFSKN